MAICKLCKQDKSLIKKSHIIPDFLYQHLYDEKHQLIKFDAIQKAKGIEKISKLPTGEYEGNLLCQQCDGDLIGKYESYLANILNNTNISEERKPKCENIENDTGVEFTRISNIDYKLTKLALLSILWKASISKRPLFKEIFLGPYEEKIRNQIYSEEALSDDDIEIIVMSWHNDNNTATDIISQPRRHKENGKTYYSFIINGFIVIFFISKNSIRKELKPFRLQEDNTLSIIHLPKGKGMDFLVKYTGAKAVIKKQKEN